MTEGSPNRPGDQRLAGTDTVLNEILASWWQALTEVIETGDQPRVGWYGAFIRNLTGRPANVVLIPDLSMPTPTRPGAPERSATDE